MFIRREICFIRSVWFFFFCYFGLFVCRGFIVYWVLGDGIRVRRLFSTLGVCLGEMFFGGRGNDGSVIMIRLLFVIYSVLIKLGLSSS